MSLNRRLKKARRLVKSQYRRGLTPLRRWADEVVEDGETYPGMGVAADLSSPVKAGPDDSEGFAFSLVELSLRLSHSHG